jgi:outer membrane receptor protein involved in Fe transport
MHAMAQATTGTLRGTVTDTNGGVIAGATVKAKSEATGVETSPTTTNGEGTYEISGLQPGKYTVTVEGTGFKRSVTTSTDVKVGIVNPLDVKLEPGNVSETVTVVASTEEVLNTEQSQISHTFEARKIEDLPSNAQGFGIDTLALLVPGVAQNSGGGTNTNGTGLSVNGNRGRSNNFQIDGSDNNDLSVGGPNLFVDNQDQVQEYQVITNNFSAQYGRNLGAVVNIVTKGGTNEFHGTGFEYHMDRTRLDTLTNRERASGLKEPPRFLSNVFGGTVGGPIIKNRAFFFASYEGIRQPSTTIVQSGGFGINPADLAKLTAAFPGNPVINTIVALNPSVLPLGTLVARTDLRNCNATTERLAGRPFTDCNRDFMDIGPTTASAVRVEGFLLERTFPTPFTQNEWSVRGDMKVTDRDNFYIRYLDQKGVTINGEGGSNGYSGDDSFFTKNFGGSYIRQMSNKTVNEFRGVRTNLSTTFGGGCDPTKAGCIPGVADIDKAQISSFNPSAIRGITLTGNALRPVGTDVTAGTGLPQGRATTLYDFADNVTTTRGKHSLIFGAEIKFTSATAPFLPNYQGNYTYAIDTTVTCPSNASSATVCPERQRRIFNNAPSAFSIALGNPTVPYTEWDQYYFVQDDFKLRPNLTLNLGVRYEYTGQPINDLSESTRQRESGAKPFFNPSLPLDARIVPLVKPDYNNFAPRFGFAWVPKFGGEKGFMHRLLGDDETVIRGGYAIAYDPAFYNILLNVANSSPFSLSLTATTQQTPATNPVITLPNSIFGSDIRDFIQNTGVLPIGKLDPKWLSQTQVSNDFHAPYSQQWSFGIQRSVGRNNIAEVRYVGNHGVGLFQSINGNPFVGSPGSTTLGGLYGFNRSITVPNPLAGQPGQPANISQTISFPSFAAQVLPSGVSGQVCVDNPATLDNEGSCNGRIHPGIGSRTIRANTGYSFYHGLQARYNGRFLKNALNLGLTYTFSKTTDNSSEIFAFGSEVASIFPQDPINYNSDYGLSGLHRPHLFSVNAIYDVPYYKEQRGILGHILGGWQLNATHVYNTGRRWTVSQNINTTAGGLGPTYLTAGESIRPFYGNPNAPALSVGITQIDAFLIGKLGVVTNPTGLISLNDANNSIIRAVTANDVRYIANGPGAAKLFGTPYGDVPRYSEEGPAINQTNFGVFKTVRVVERVKIQLRGEFFNVFNHPQPGYGVTRNGSLPNTLVDNAGNIATPFADNQFIALARRRVQVGLRIIF